MLVLSRKKLESICIGNDVEVVVLDISKNRVRLGFRCPNHVTVTRQELKTQFSSSSAQDEKLDELEVELVLS
ncbi:carbon storage regulator [Planctomicrobium sp. SH668]|uniref:carbon storage regulator n=1 Tax=Planctomicrobium sp. SH668 TaxID=3448126 RepID=UPI003F5BFBBA